VWLEELCQWKVWESNPWHSGF